jgi:preprotein translocase subunit YajC
MFRMLGALAVCSPLVMADPPAQSSNGFMSLLPMLAFIAILYFLLIRPQQKRTKQHQALVASVKKGDKVVTNSGIIAVVSKVVSDQEIVLEIADGVHCRFYKSSIANIVNMNESAPQGQPNNVAAISDERKAAQKPPADAGPLATKTTSSKKDDKPVSGVRKKAPIKKDS